MPLTFSLPFRYILTPVTFSTLPSAPGGQPMWATSNVSCVLGEPHRRWEREGRGQVICFLPMDRLCPSTKVTSSLTGLMVQFSPCGGQWPFPPSFLPASRWQCLAATELGWLPYPLWFPDTHIVFVNKPSSLSYFECAICFLLGD